MCTAQLSDKTDANNLDDIRNGDANHIKPNNDFNNHLIVDGTNNNNDDDDDVDS